MVGLLIFGMLNLTMASTSGDVSLYREQESQYGDTYPLRITQVDWLIGFGGRKQAAFQDFRRLHFKE